MELVLCMCLVANTECLGPISGVNDDRREGETAERAVAELTKDGQHNVDEKVSAASDLEEDTQRREDDGEDDLADVAVETKSHN